jgi:hypothetical protein
MTEAAVVRRLADLENERDDLREVLSKYGAHLLGCAYLWTSDTCDCGLHRRLKTLSNL